MLKQKVLLFDIDGTLIESGEGIVNCASSSLKAFGIEVPKEKLTVFVGPPLRDSYQRFGLCPKEAEEASALFRKEYNQTGIYQCQLYEGITTTLETLSKKGYLLLIATTKSVKRAGTVLDFLHLTPYFSKIFGAGPNGYRDDKPSIIRDAIASLDLEKQQPIMIGDTHYDIQGAKANKIPSIWVSWGYGEREKIEEAKPDYRVDSQKELIELIDSL